MAAGPRAAFILWWFLQPNRVMMTFNGWIWALLGMIFLPWTALMYLIVAPGGLSLVNWIFLILAFAVDMGTYFGNGEAGRRRYAS